jgi:hypothetical protein
VGTFREEFAFMNVVMNKSGNPAIHVGEGLGGRGFQVNEVTFVGQSTHVHHAHPIGDYATIEELVAAMPALEKTRNLDPNAWYCPLVG